MTEGQLAARFEEDGVTLARLCPDNLQIGYILLTSKAASQRLIKSSPLSIQEEFHDEDERRPLKVASFSLPIKLGRLPLEIKLSIAEELEIVRTTTTNMARVAHVERV
jgi:hypothetical protein